ncbi:HAMP domain-containing histidine kinase [Candidatus Peregrinibacteria bacterium]|nr:HAMP domain-containing histidine kinase [Candidatus Peregrinibacteria bacterium]
MPLLKTAVRPAGTKRRLPWYALCSALCALVVIAASGLLMVDLFDASALHGMHIATTILGFVGLQQFSIAQREEMILVLCILAAAMAGFDLARLARALHTSSVGMQEQMESERLALLDLATHQLGAPLATFKWWLEILRDPEMESTIDRKEIYAQVKEGVDRLDALMQSLSKGTIARLDAQHYRKDTIDSLKYLIVRAVEEARMELNAHFLTVKMKIDEKLPPVQADGVELFSVLRELLKNAIAFSKPNGTITVTIKKKNRMCSISMADEGHGIPEEDLPRVFEKFFRASNAAKYKPVGNGMGLATAREIVERCGGTIAIASTEDEGTTVSLMLPFAPKTKTVFSEQ